jgi:hypothetical protein
MIRRLCGLVAVVVLAVACSGGSKTAVLPPDSHRSPSFNQQGCGDDCYFGGPDPTPMPQPTPDIVSEDNCSVSGGIFFDQLGSTTDCFGGSHPPRGTFRPGNCAGMTIVIDSGGDSYVDEIVTRVHFHMGVRLAPDCSYQTFD